MLYGTGKYTYELVDGWAKCPEGFSFIDVIGIATDSQDKVYVLNRSAYPIMIFDREGTLLAQWDVKFLKGGHGIYVGPDGSVYCTDYDEHTVTKYTPDGKTILLTLGNKNQPSDTGYVPKPGMNLETIKRTGPPFNRPAGVALSSSGEIYVSDGYGNARVHKFTPDGTLLLSWGKPGTAQGQFRLPHFVWVDKQERVWVCDRENNRIQIFNTKGEFLSQWTDLSHPSAMSIDDEGTVYVSEMSQRVSIFTNEGKLLARWGNQGQAKETTLFVAPHAIAVDSRGDIYVGCWTMGGKFDRGSRTIQKFTKKT